MQGHTEQCIRLIIIVNVTYMVQIRIKCSKCAMSTVTGTVAYVIKNVFRHVQTAMCPVEVQLVKCFTPPNHYQQNCGHRS